MKKREIKDAIIWRKSVYDNHFKCNNCGAKLFDEKENMPTDNLGFNAEGLDVDNRCFCIKCKNLVATIKQIPCDDSGLMGYWGDKAEEYEKHFEQAEEYMQKLKKMTKELNRKLSEIAEKDHMIQILEQKVSNKDAEIKCYAEKLQSLTKEYEEVSHRLDEVIAMKGVE